MTVKILIDIQRGVLRQIIDRPDHGLIVPQEVPDPLRRPRFDRLHAHRRALRERYGLVEDDDPVLNMGSQHHARIILPSGILSAPRDDSPECQCSCGRKQDYFASFTRLTLYEAWYEPQS